MKFDPSNLLLHKNILLGITGGIAAYKSADLVRRLKENGANIKVVMTPAATEFVTELTFQALSNNSVHTSLLDPEAESIMGHIELARWADATLIAPCSANTLAKLANGEADNLLTTLCLASTEPVAVAPAMNQAMWTNTATQTNIQTLKNRGYHIFGPASGHQACGEVGEGRMLEPADLLNALCTLFINGALSGRKILVTAGPTREAIDPVRFISNHSSGKMGYAIAKAAYEMGAAVTLVSGPVQLSASKGIKRVDVESAQEMYDAVMQEITDVDIFIASAAVSDYHISDKHSKKIKKSDENLALSLSPNPDILAKVASLNKAPFTVGFAAETQGLEDQAKLKLSKKSLNMIAANLVANTQNMGFNSDHNALSVFYKSPRGIEQTDLQYMSKTKLARKLMSVIVEQYQIYRPSATNNSRNANKNKTNHS